MTKLQRYLVMGSGVGCPRDQMRNFVEANVVLQERQLAASAAARLCDHPDGPIAVGYGGARGGGKSHWLLAQMGADDCQRVPGLKCLLLRKVGKANMEHFEDLRRKLFAGLNHEFSAYRGVLTFANGSRIVAGHFQNESDIDSYLGLEYDVIGIEEATTLSLRKYTDISTCCRSSKTWTPLEPQVLQGSQASTLNPQPIPWRPRIYSTTNPGGIGHAWYKRLFIDPHRARLRTSGLSSTSPATAVINTQPSTIFVPARVTDNEYNNPEYRKVLEGLNGWQRRAWLEGDWDLAAGQFFTTFRRDVHVIGSDEGGNLKAEIGVWDDLRAVEWFGAMDYGFAHHTVFLLGCKDGDGNIFVVDEHAERLWLPQRHVMAIKAMLARHRVAMANGWMTADGPEMAVQKEEVKTRELKLGDLPRIAAGADVFSRQSDGTSIADQYARFGIRMRVANTDRVNGWAEILQLLGDPDAAGRDCGDQLTPSLAPKLFIHSRCARLIETLPALQHDPNRPEDVLKVDADDEGNGGDDAADALRYLVATKVRTVVQRKLRGL